MLLCNQGGIFMATIRIEKEEYKKTSTVVDCDILANNSITIKLPSIKGKLFRSIHKTKSKGKKTKEIIQEVEL